MKIFAIVIIVWVLFEIIINFSLRSKKARSVSHDRNSLAIIWIVLTLSIAAGIFASFYFKSFSPVFSYSGILFIIIGLVVRWIAMLSLKERFTTNIAIQDGHKLKTDGIYKYIRHPSYSGSLLSFLGLGIAFGNWVSLCLIIIPIFIAFAYRIRIEEKMLIEHFGLSYKEYMLVTKKIVPFIY